MQSNSGGATPCTAPVDSEACDSGASSCGPGGLGDTPFAPERETSRRSVMREAACVAGLWASSGLLPAWAANAKGLERRYENSMLVNELGEPLRASQLRPGEVHLFNYPYVSTPVFLLSLGSVVGAGEQQIKDAQRYATPAGVGPARSIVAFVAICAHKLVYPTSQLSFIGVRAGTAGEPTQVIHCCSDQSRYDPTRGARVMAGPAPQPLAAVSLTWDARQDTLHATGTQGAELFDAFFEKYAFRLQTEWGSKARQPIGPRTVTKPAASYTRQWQRCATS